MKVKKFSNHLLEVRTVLELSPEEMAFILDKTEQMYKRYEHGDWDKIEHTRQKEDINIKIATFDLQIEKKILMLKTALWKYRMSTYFLTIKGSMIKKQQEAFRKNGQKSVRKSVRTPSSNGHNLKEKG